MQTNIAYIDSYWSMDLISRPDAGTSGASIPPLAMMHSPISEEIFRLGEKFSRFAFSRQIFRFSSANISDDLFLNIDHHNFFIFPPIFPISVHFPLFCENYYFPLLLQIIFPCVSKNSRVFYIGLFRPMCISFPPYFDHDAFMHHTMHVLDAPVLRHLAQPCLILPIDLTSQYLPNCFACMG